MPRSSLSCFGTSHHQKGHTQKPQTRRHEPLCRRKWGPAFPFNARTVEHSLKRIGNNIVIYAVSLLVGAALDGLSVPLAWMIGAMVAGAALKLGGFSMQLFPRTRLIGQMAIGATVGLTFTHEALAMVAELIGPMLLLTLSSLVAGLLSALILVRVAGSDAVSACLASLAIGPVESANLARHYDVDPAPIVFSQCLRLVLLVGALPGIIVWLDGSIHDPSAALRADHWTLSGVGLLVLVAIGGGFLFKAIRFPNPWFNGPCAAAVAAALLDLPVTPLPYPLLVAAQVLLGVWLGAVFERHFLTASRRYALIAPVAVLVMIALCEIFALGVGLAIALPWQVALLVGAPGGVAEMALTAKILEAGVATIIAFHLLRIFLSQMCVPVLVRITARRSGSGRRR